MPVIKRNVKRAAVHQPKGYRVIPLTRNQVTLVSVKDYVWLSQWNWFASWNYNTCSFYTARTDNNVTPHRKIGMSSEIIGCRSGEIADHKSHDTLDNRRSNLRRCTDAQNRKNRKPYKNSGIYKGVGPYRHEWHAAVRIDGYLKHLGYHFKTAEDAARAYDKAAKKAFGKFASLNFPDG